MVNKITGLVSLRRNLKGLFSFYLLRNLWTDLAVQKRSLLVVLSQMLTITSCMLNVLIYYVMDD